MLSLPKGKARRNLDMIILLTSLQIGEHLSGAKGHWKWTK